MSETLPEIIRHVPARSETSVDGSNVVRMQTLYPRGVVQCLRDYFARCTVTLEFDQNEAGVRCYSEQIDSASEARVLLPADEHPLIRQQVRSCNNHVLQQLLPRERGFREGLRFDGDLPDGVSDRHEFCSL